jgi:hypothetical protein
MDLVAVSESVALMAATGAMSGLGEHAALGTVSRVRERIRLVFGGDTHSMNALNEAVADPADEGRIADLAAELAHHAKRDAAFREELGRWAAEYAPGSVTQNVRAGRDTYTAGRDMTVHQRPTD